MSLFDWLFWMIFRDSLIGVLDVLWPGLTSLLGLFSIFLVVAWMACWACLTTLFNQFSLMVWMLHGTLLVCCLGYLFGSILDALLGLGDVLCWLIFQFLVGVLDGLLDLIYLFGWLIFIMVAWIPYWVCFPHF